jgi:hypothetical protein
MPANGSGVVHELVVVVVGGGIDVKGTSHETGSDGSLRMPSASYARTRKMYVVPSTAPVKVHTV